MGIYTHQSHYNESEDLITCKAPVIPACLKPLMASWGLLHTSKIEDISQLALKSFIALIRTSILMPFTDTPLSSCLRISWEHHILNRFLMESLSGLFIVRSIGWSLSVQFAGTTIIRILLACNICLNFSVCCPLKTSNMPRLAGTVETGHKWYARWFNFQLIPHSHPFGAGRWLDNGEGG